VGERVDVNGQTHEQHSVAYGRDQTGKPEQREAALEEQREHRADLSGS